MAIINIQPARSPSLARRPELQPDAVIPGDAVLMPGARLYAGSVFGAGLFVGDGASIAEGCRFGARCVIGRNATVGDHVTLGDEVRVQTGAHLVGGMVVGDRTFIGVGVVTCNDQDPQPYVYDGARIKPPVIGADCMIGSGAVLCPGVRIGDGARVHAGAVVMRDVPPGGVVRAFRGPEAAGDMHRWDNLYPLAGALG